MGCDIHLHVEIKADGEWIHHNAPRVSRDYALFAKMAGVRNYGEIVPVSRPRGVPWNASKTTRFCFAYMGTDAHSASWLSSEEVVDVIKWHRENCGIVSDVFGYLFGNGYDDFAKHSEEKPKGLEDFRFIFWFDN